MSRNLQNLDSIQTELSNARSIRDVTLIARVACGYHFDDTLASALRKLRATYYTNADLAWFRHPIGGES